MDLYKVVYERNGNISGATYVGLKPYQSVEDVLRENNIYPNRIINMKFIGVVLTMNASNS